MTEFTRTRFVLAVLDLKRSTGYYTTVLGLAIGVRTIDGHRILFGQEFGS